MNKSKIANILHLFYSYTSQIVDEHDAPDFVNLADAIDDPDNEVVFMGWEDKDGEEYRIKFTERGLSNARVEDGNLVMEDNEGDEITIAFMESRKLSLVAEDTDWLSLKPH